MFTFRNNHRFTGRSRRVLWALAGSLLLCLAGSAAVRGHPCPDCPEISNEILTVPSGCTYTISGPESYTAVVVESGGTLSMESAAQSTGILVVQEYIHVDAGATFRFNASSGIQPKVTATGNYYPVTLDGSFTVTGSLGGAFDRISSSTFHLLSGGSITSDSGPVIISADIENDGKITATSGNILISGAVLDGSTGAFSANGGNMFFTADVNNDGTITATGGSDVLFSGTISNWSTGLFQVTAAGSDMTFDQTNTPNLTGDGDFNIEAGRMGFKESLTTAGGYRQTGGQTKVAAGKTFTATGAY
jgi:hypothetical protein